MKWLRNKRIIVLSILAALAFVGWRYRYEIAETVRDALGIELPVDPRPAGVSELEWCEQNYSEEIAELASEYSVSYPYLMALIVLETGGDKPAGHRYEKHIFEKLKKVRDGQRSKFESIKSSDLAGMDDEALKNLATSWGPFQLMGYKAIRLGVQVDELRDDETAAQIGVRWINDEYGHFLRKKKWKDAFHYHNTGDRFPLSGKSHTHDPYYVSDGIRYMKYFELNLPESLKKSADSSGN